MAPGRTRASDQALSLGAASGSLAKLADRAVGAEGIPFARSSGSGADAMHSGDSLRMSLTVGCPWILSLWHQG